MELPFIITGPKEGFGAIRKDEEFVAGLKLDGLLLEVGLRKNAKQPAAALKLNELVVADQYRIGVPRTGIVELECFDI